MALQVVVNVMRRTAVCLHAASKQVAGLQAQISANPLRSN